MAQRTREELAALELFPRRGRVTTRRWAAHQRPPMVWGDRYHLTRIAMWQALIGSAANAVTIGGVM
ncbi:hypothetical protein [Rhodococcus sp. APC 3903]|uniref:hypothetical protein n=1 Tax=Rhodococcus sp. APC 3903 TaxID=3035193 RepID=UPI0025B5059F|nr:hypothetical protein [Rhodococcus sp. APC 3903]MDN3459925.1 hypothetical protein [Rhodococcus sp. APC 3903]